MLHLCMILETLSKEKVTGHWGTCAEHTQGQGQKQRFKERPTLTAREQTDLRLQSSFRHISGCKEKLRERRGSCVCERERE